jgi:hypothetical protein
MDSIFCALGLLFFAHYVAVSKADVLYIVLPIVLNTKIYEGLKNKLLISSTNAMTIILSDTYDC